MRYFILFILTISGVFSAELPREAQREMDTFVSGQAKIDAEYQIKLNVLIDKTVKVLNEVSKKAKTVEERRAIDDEIISLQKLRKDDDLLGDGKKGNPWVGRFVNNEGRLWGDIFEDGTATHLMINAPGKWTMEKGKLVVVWTGTAYVDTLDPPDKDGVIKGTNKSGGTWTMKRESK